MAALLKSLTSADEVYKHVFICPLQMLSFTWCAATTIPSNYSWVEEKLYWSTSVLNLFVNVLVAIESHVDLLKSMCGAMSRWVLKERMRRSIDSKVHSSHTTHQAQAQTVQCSIKNLLNYISPFISHSPLSTRRTLSYRLNWIVCAAFLVPFLLFSSHLISPTSAHSSF